MTVVYLSSVDPYTASLHQYLNVILAEEKGVYDFIN